MPPEAGGVFVQGGTVGNLSALVAARHTARRGADGARARSLDGGRDRRGPLLDRAAASVMDVDVLARPRTTPTGG